MSQTTQRLRQVKSKSIRAKPKRSKKRSARLRLFWRVFLVAPFLIGSLIVVFLFSNTGLEEPTEILIDQGSSISAISTKLEEAGVTRSAFLFRNCLRAMAFVTKRHCNAGYYRFTPDQSTVSILRDLFDKDRGIIIKTTYPEGIALKDFARITSDKVGVSEDDFMELCHNGNIGKEHGISNSSLEGYLYPSTYLFPKGLSAKKIVERLVAEGIRVWNTKCAGLLKNTTLTKHQVLTLASIVEAESSVAEERPRIVGVYLNRLRRGMILQADPTVAYGLDLRGERLLYSDLEVDTPYNTYMHKGLPPTPINSPSLSSILAVLQPEENSYYYFVARGDGTRRHNFSENSSQHEKNVRSYRRAKKRLNEN